MAEDEKNGEDENLNSEGQDKDVKTSYTADEVAEIKKQMQSDGDKWVQKLISEKKNYDRVLDEVWKVSADEAYLVELHNENPAVAKIILDKYYEWKDIESFKESIAYKEDISDPKVIKRMVESEAKKLAETNLISDKKQEFITKLKMTDEEVKDFEEAFSERTQLKTFNVTNLDKHFEKAYRDVNDNTESLKEMKKQEAIANALATWDGKGWKQVTTKKETSVQKNSEYNKNFLKERWIL